MYNDCIKFDPAIRPSMWNHPDFFSINYGRSHLSTKFNPYMRD